jgi:hypothetical protein
MLVLAALQIMMHDISHDIGRQALVKNVPTFSSGLRYWRRGATDSLHDSMQVSSYCQIHPVLLFPTFSADMHAGHDVAMTWHISACQTPSKNTRSPAALTSIPQAVHNKL